MKGKEEEMKHPNIQAIFFDLGVEANGWIWHLL